YQMSGSIGKPRRLFHLPAFQLPGVTNEPLLLSLYIRTGPDEVVTINALERGRYTTNDVTLRVRAIATRNPKTNGLVILDGDFDRRFTGGSIRDSTQTALYIPELPSFLSIVEVDNSDGTRSKVEWQL